MPDTWVGSPWRRALRWLVVLKIGVTILIFLPALQTFDQPKALVGRGVSWVLVAILVLAVARYGPAVVPRSRLHLAVAAVLLTQISAAVFARDCYVAAFGEWDRFLGLTGTLDVVVLYLAVAVAFRSAADHLLLAAGIAISGGAAALVGLLQRIGIDPIGGMLGLPRELAVRPYSTFGNPDMFGQFLGPAFGASAAVALLARGRLRVAAGALSLLFLATIGVIATRAVLLGLAATALVIVALVIRQGTSLPRAARVTVLALVPVVALGVVLTPLGGRAMSTLRGEGLEDRLLIWQSAVAIVRDHPILGVGPDNFGVAYPPYRQPGTAPVFNYETQTNAHSWPLQAAATTGILGLVALTVFVVTVAVALARAIGSIPLVAAPALCAAVAYWAQGIVTVGSVSVDWIPYAAASAAVIAVPADDLRPVREVPQPFAIGLIAFATVAASVGSFALRADIAAGQASLALGRRDMPRAVAEAMTATSLDSGRAEYWSLLGAGYHGLGRWRDVLDAFSEAARRKPHVSFYWQQIARSRTQLVLAGDPYGGGADAALGAARHAVELNPNEGDPYYVLAVLSLDLAQPEEALRAALRAIELRARFTNADEYAAAAAERTTDVALASKLLEETLRHRETAVLRLALARTVLRAGRTGEAREHVRRALELDPGNPDALKLRDSLPAR